MRRDPPQVSVCVPTYNRATYLREAIESVLRQTLQDFEIVVFDDASTDETNKTLAEISDPRLRYFRQPCNVGVASNRNSCVAAATGRYIAWLDSDDVYFENMLALQSAVLDEHPNVGLVHGAFGVINSEGCPLPAWPLPFVHDVVEKSEDAFSELIVNNYVRTSTVLVRRDCYRDSGSYTPELGTGEDWDMWIRIARRWDVAYTATAVAKYRYHDQSLSSQGRKSTEQLRADTAVVERVLATECDVVRTAPALERKAKAALAAKALIAAGDAFTLGRRNAALSATRLALTLAPALLRSKHSWLLLVSIIRGSEYANYRSSKVLLGRLHAQLRGTKYARRLEKIATVAPEWERSLRDVAETVRQLVPRARRVAAVDKYDPTLLHLSGRRGWHFPDRRLLPGGYPSESAVVIDHLEDLRRRGADFIVFPSSAFWWLEYYDGFRRHLDVCYRRIWGDNLCVIYDLKGFAPLRKKRSFSPVESA